MRAREEKLEKLKAVNPLPLLDDQVMRYAQQLRQLDCAFYKHLYESDWYNGSRANVYRERVVVKPPMANRIPRAGNRYQRVKK